MKVKQYWVLNTEKISKVYFIQRAMYLWTSITILKFQCNG